MTHPRTPNNFCVRILMILGFCCFTPFATFAENNEDFGYEYSSDIECSDGTSSAEYCNSLYGCYTLGHTTIDGQVACSQCPKGTYKGSISKTSASCSTCEPPTHTPGKDGNYLQFDWSHSLGLHDTKGCIWRVICPNGYYAATGSYNNLACHPCSMVFDTETKTNNRYDPDEKNNFYKGRDDKILAYHSSIRSGTSYDPGEYAIVDEGLDSGTQNTYGQYGCDGTCPENAKSNTNGTGCECICGYESKGSNAPDMICEPKTISYKYYLTKDDTTPKHTDAETYVPNKQRIILSKQSAENLKFIKTGYTITKWKDKNDEYTLDLGINYPWCEDLNLYAIFEPNTFTITYMANDQECTTQECTYDDTNCLAKAQSVCTAQLEQGQYFTHWTYNNSNYQPKDRISNISNGTNFTMVADVKECENGYYCASGERKKCPAGATSYLGSSAITDCHLLGGQTIIKDKHGNEFNLPNGIKINYHN